LRYLLYKLILAGHDIPLVVTQPDRPAGRGKKLQSPPVKLLAEEYGLDIVQPESVKTDEFHYMLTSLEPDIMVVVAYGRILPDRLLSIPMHGCINVHGSLLPAYRGSAPVQRSVMAGEKVVGVTTMYLDKGMDTGDIILQKTLTWRRTATVES
jgi:methionyl-tRNA formyltransferase